MRTYILFAVILVSFVAILVGLYDGISKRRKRWLFSLAGGMALTFATLFWLRPIIDEGWAIVDQEILRIELRALNEKVDILRVELDEKSAALSEKNKRLEEIALAQKIYLDRMGSLLSQLRRTRAALEVKGVRFTEVANASPLSRETTVGDIIEKLSSEIASFHSLNIEEERLRKAVLRLVGALNYFSALVPERRMGTIQKAERRAKVIDEAVEDINIVSAKLDMARQVDGFSSQVQSSLRLALVALKTNGSLKSPDPSILDQQLFSEQHRQELVLSAIASMGDISIAPAVARVDNPSTDQERSAQDLLFKLTPLEEPPPGKMIYELRGFSKGKEEALLFHRGSYVADDIWGTIVAPMLSFKNWLEVKNIFNLVERIYVVGSADQRGYDGPLYRSDLLSGYLKKMQVLMPGSPIASAGYKDVAVGEYVRNSDLPNLRAAWLAGLVGSIVQNTQVEVIDGGLVDGTLPDKRNARLFVLARRELHQ